MKDNKITYEDVEEYQSLFMLAPALMLEKFARRKSNLALRFKPVIEKYMGELNETQKKELDIILSSDIEELQSIMKEAYEKTGIKQYAILANPENKEFIKINLDEIRKMV
jgi:hypothetical protein